MAIALGARGRAARLLGTVLQQQVAAQASEEEARGAGFLLRLARQPRWLAGIVADGLGFVAQAAALGLGRTPSCSCSRCSPPAWCSRCRWARFERKPVSRPEILGALAVTAVRRVSRARRPGCGRDNASATAWVVSFAHGGGAVRRRLTLGARGRAPLHRAALLGTAAGILFALSAALTQATVEQLDDGSPHRIRALAAVCAAGGRLREHDAEPGLAPGGAPAPAANPDGAQPGGEPVPRDARLQGDDPRRHRHRCWPRWRRSR